MLVFLLQSRQRRLLFRSPVRPGVLLNAAAKVIEPFLVDLYGGR